jgi:hypothetical protein
MEYKFYLQKRIPNSKIFLAKALKKENLADQRHKSHCLRNYKKKKEKAVSKIEKNAYFIYIQLKYIIKYFK